MSFYECSIDDRLYLKSDLIDNKKVAHAFTSKMGGVSCGKITGLNLGFRVNDDKNSIIENYHLVEKDLDIDLNKTVLAKQTHTDNIRIVTEADFGKGIVRESDIEDTDGLITSVKDTALVVFSADCVPVLIYDKKQNVIAAIHAGWRGSVKGISAKAIDILTDTFNSNPKDIVAAIGPSIASCCFEFGDDAVIYFDEKYYTKQPNGKYHIDLWSLNRDMLLKKGVLPENIDISNVCTVCNSDKFYSYRTHKEKTGRQAAIIMLKS